MHRIGTRLTLSFVTVVALMAAGYGIALWQFRELRIQQQNLDRAYQESQAVLNLNAKLFALRDKLVDLADSQRGDQFASEASGLRRSMLNDIETAKSALQSLPPNVERNSFVLVSLDTIESTLPVQIDALSDLAKASDWRAIRLRSRSQVRQLTTLTSALVNTVAEGVAAERSRVLEATQLAESRVMLILLGAGSFTLVVAAALGLLVTRSITRPLAALGRGANALAHGDFGYRVTVSGTDELAELGHVFNNTARQLRELYENLQQNEARFRSLIEHSSDFIIVLDSGGVIQYLSPSGERTLGVAADAVLGRSISVLIHAEETAAAARALNTGPRDTVQTFRFRYVHPRGEERILEAVRTNMLGNPAVTGIVINARDITERRRAEDELQQLQADLAHVARVASMGELSASITHEVSQPLAAINVNATAALHWLTAEPPNLENVKEALARVSRDGSHAANVVSRIRAFFRKSPPRKEQVDINETILEVLALLGSELRTKDVLLETEFDAGLPRISGDRVQLQQVILNLIVNAIEAMRGCTPPHLLLVRSSRNHDTSGIKVSVRDSGPGLDSVNVTRLFDAFYTTKASGMGMGLPISRSIVEAHGGKLSAAPNADRGATFEFALPLGEPGNKTPSPPEQCNAGAA